MKLRAALLLAAAHAHSAVALRSLRGDDAASTFDDGAPTTKRWILQRVLGFDEGKLRESLKKSIGFGGRSLLPSSSAGRVAEAMVGQHSSQRNLNPFSATDPCAAATDNWPKSLTSGGNAPCGYR